MATYWIVTYNNMATYWIILNLDQDCVWIWGEGVCVKYLPRGLGQAQVLGIIELDIYSFLNFECIVLYFKFNILKVILI